MRLWEVLGPSKEAPTLSLRMFLALAHEAIVAIAPAGAYQPRDIHRHR